LAIGMFKILLRRFKRDDLQNNPRQLDIISSNELLSPLERLASPLGGNIHQTGPILAEFHCHALSVNPKGKI